MDLVDPSGTPVLLKGCNIGNWLVNEFWMFGIAGEPGVPRDQWSLEQTLTQRFGADEDLRLMNLLRASWMTERDWQNIQSYRFNLIRLPFNYRLLEDDARPKQLRPDAFFWLDKAVTEADRHGLYVIIDMHGVQGGQTLNDHTGRLGQNKLWSVPENQERMAWLWQQIAQHFRGRNNVVGYDPMNEPYGGTKPQVVAVFKKAYAAIRSVDPDTMIFAHGATDNFDHFGDPKANGWHNVGFEMHYYPGLFGDAPRIKSNISHLRRLASVEKKVKAVDVPFLVGEMNVVIAKSGGASMMRRFYDADASYGWLTTMWSYKVITQEGGVSGGSWGMFTNSKPAKYVNFDTASEPDIEEYFRSFATQPLMPYEELRRDLTEANPTLTPLPLEETPRTVAPKDDLLPGWESTDIGGALKGGLDLHGSAFDLYGGGDDIWGSSDQFRFLHQRATGDFDLAVTLQTVEETQGYTKAGLMVRDSLNPDAATAFLSVFPSGGAQIGVRPEDGGEIGASNAPNAPLPGAKLEISRRGDTLTFSINGVEVAKKRVAALSGQVFVGPIALSHTNAELTKIGYSGLTLTGG
jgi:endoglucanase